MNVISIPSWANSKIAFCVVDNTRTYIPEIKQLMKNLSDGVLSNIHTKGYHIYQWIDEDELLHHVSNLDYTYAVVISTGTEFINGSSFFDIIEDYKSNDFFIAGHVLDRKDAYYELHDQCYMINLEHYKNLDRPFIGKQELGQTHTQLIPIRSTWNYHDDYTPLWTKKGTEKGTFNHKCHGWNILSIGFENDLDILVWNESARNSKKHYYPEMPDQFYKHVSWAYHRMNYCMTDFVHTGLTETIDTKGKFQQIVTPASGCWFLDYLEPNSTVVFYDYNQSSLDYWEKNTVRKSGIDYKFVRCDLLTNSDFVQELDPKLNTLVNLSNVFNYEATSFFYSESYRLYKEKELTDKIKATFDQVEIVSCRTAKPYSQIPTWHINY